MLKWQASASWQVACISNIIMVYVSHEGHLGLAVLLQRGRDHAGAVQAGVLRRKYRACQTGARRHMAQCRKRRQRCGLHMQSCQQACKRYDAAPTASCMPGSKVHHQPAACLTWTEIACFVATQSNMRRAALPVQAACPACAGTGSLLHG